MKRNMLLLMLVLFAAASVSACNTVEGAGKDVEKVGEKIEGAAQDCKDEGGCND